MPRGTRRVVVAAAAVLLVALAVPAAAFAGGGGGKCNASACKVYSEQGAPNSGGQQATTASGRIGGAQEPQTPKSLSRVLSHAGKDRGPLSRLFAGDSALGGLPSGSGGGSPSILGAAFDLGVGPTVLIAILLATALGLAARGNVRDWLRKRSSS